MRRWSPGPDPAVIPRLLAALFCVYAAVAVPAIALLMPPFQAADELNHAERADQIAYGGLLAVRLDDSRAGGTVDLGLDRLAATVEGVRFHREVKETRAMADRAAGTGWGGKGVMSFPNTAIYPPLLYLPSALGQAAARTAGLSVLHGMLLSRLLNGAASAAAAAAAIALSGGLAPLLFTTLCLPMVLALFGSMSQDGPMIALSALSAVLLVRAPAIRHGLVLGCAALAMVAMARPAYLPLCLLPLLSPVPLRARLGAAGGAIGAVLGWTLLADLVTLPQVASVQMARQVQALVLHPGLCLTLLRTTMQIQWDQGCPYCRQAVGVLGWLDTTLPNPYYALTGLVLLAAFCVSCAPASLDTRRRIAVAGMVVAAAGAVFVLQYLSWSPIGSRTIEGIQGRYVLPLVPFLGLALPRGRVRLPAWAVAGLCFYPALSIAVTLRAIVFRYYL